MPVLDGRKESCSSKANSSNCLLVKWAVTAVCHCTSVSMPVLDGRRESCSSKANSSNCLLVMEAVTAVCHRTSVSMPVLDGRRESCSSKANSSNCLLVMEAVTAVCFCQLTLTVSSSPRPWIEEFDLPEKINMAVTKSVLDPKFWIVSITS